jgi:hypothetical protein
VNRENQTDTINHVSSDKDLQSSIDRYGPDNPVVRHVKCHPLTELFPDELIVREKSITVVRNSLLTNTYESMAILDIGRIQLNNTAFFAALRCIGLNPAHELHLKGLRKKDASEVEEIIESLMLRSKYDRTTPTNSQGHKHIAGEEEQLEKPRT